ncbi:MAG TPA: hypothetical protein VFU02_01050 [Polyangiaceae bacterium]|nr:hypothetical protein [Polyangiaceae bacterium]
MSMTVMAYAIELDELKPLLGSKRGDVKPPDAAHPDVAAAFGELLDGKTSPRDPHDYVDALELMCRVFGRGLPNSGLATIDTGHYEKVNEALKQYRLGFDLDTVVSSGASVGHAALDHSRSFGFVDAARLEAAVHTLAGNAMTSDDSEVDEALATVESWLEIATGSGLDIMGFFY